MAVEIDLTDGAVTVTAATKQALASAVDVSKLDTLDLICEQITSTGPTTTGPTVRVVTAMQMDREAGRVVLGTFTGQSLVAGMKAEMLRMVGPAKYIWWEVADMGSLTSFTLSIRGMGRACCS